MLVSLVCSTVLAEPAGKGAPDAHDLLSSCRMSLKHGFNGIEGMLCAWYVTPCDCKIGNAEYPQVCLPYDAKEEELAKLIIENLQNNKVLLGKDAAFAANSILSGYYPCP